MISKMAVFSSHVRSSNQWKRAIRNSLGYSLGAIAIFLREVLKLISWIAVTCCRCQATSTRMNALEREQQLAKIKFRVWVWLLLLWLVCMFGFDAAQFIWDSLP